jgi:hypothetical protein
MVGTLEAYVYPLIGDISVEPVNTAAVRTVVDPIWYKIPETTARVRNRIELILDAATASGLRNGDNPARASRRAAAGAFQTASG